MPSPCQSLLLRFDGSDDDLGVRIVTESGLALAAEGAYPVRMTFWADAALGRIHRGSRFALRHPVRVVGQGEVLHLDPDRRSSAVQHCGTRPGEA